MYAPLLCRCQISCSIASPSGSQVSTAEQMQSSHCCCWHCQTHTHLCSTAAAVVCATVTDQELSALHLLFGTAITRACDIVDAEDVEIVRAVTAQRTYYSIHGSDAFPYTCTAYHCTCPAFTNNTIMGSAIYVSVAFGYDSLASEVFDVFCD